MSSSAPLKLRSATLNDAENLSVLAARSFRDAFGADNTPENMQQYLSTSLTLETTQRELADTSKIFLLAESDTLLGYVMLSMATSEDCVRGEPSMEIERIYVDNAAIGQGVGAALMRASIEQAKEHRCETLWLGVWEKNQHAIRFYERWEFKTVGKRHFQLGSDLQNDLVMSRPVGDLRSGSNVNLRDAENAEAGALSKLAQRSKAYWGYSSEFMTACVDELTWSEADLASPDYSFVVAVSEGRRIGFYATKRLSKSVCELEALFVEPESIGRGIGRMLIEHAIASLQRGGVQTLSIQGDPNAEAFYIAAGAHKVGDRPSGSIPGRTLPLFEIALDDRKLVASHRE